MTMRDDLSQPVGPGRPNRADDVRKVQRLLDQQASRTGVLIPVTGVYDHRTQAALKIFQQRVLRMTFATGTVSPHDATLRSLQETPAQRLMAGAAGGLHLPQQVDDGRIAEEDFQHAAQELGCDVRVIKAIAAKEYPPTEYFRSIGRPPILYERHLFSRFTGRRFDKDFPDIANPLPYATYGLYSSQYPKLERAWQLDATAALRATSWGTFQILGDNCTEAGYGVPPLFVAAMCQSSKLQVEAFVTYMKFDAARQHALVNKNWQALARMYNGKNFRKNHYDTDLEDNYNHAKP